MTEEKSKSNEKNSNIIFIGKKPLVNYVKSVLIQFEKKGFNEVIIRSRGKFISKAVDVAEIVKRSLQKEGIKVREIEISSEHFESEGKATNISSMNIILVKNISS